jgi:hypothetical protein
MSSLLEDLAVGCNANKLIRLSVMELLPLLSRCRLQEHAYIINYAEV